MKKTFITFVTAFLLFSASAVVEGPNPGEGELAITSGSSTASGTTAVGPNGTEYSSSVKMAGRNPNISIGDKVENVTYNENETSFQGFIQAPNPCHVLEQETEKASDGKYIINIQTVVENTSQQCITQTVMIKYEGSFESSNPHTLEIRHNNQTVREIENPDKAGPDPKDTRKKGTISKIVEFFQNLF